jgi:alginate O-acetyltransferase complex protein AlgI
MFGAHATAVTPFTVRWYLTPELLLALVAGAIGSMPVGPAVARWRERLASEGLAWPATLATVTVMAALFFAAVMQMAARTYSPFIYFRF